MARIRFSGSTSPNVTSVQVVGRTDLETGGSLDLRV
jgi:hypothetical protein